MPWFVPQYPAKARKDPLGPVAINQLHGNAEAIDGLVLSEHLSEGQHNALEVPWVLGHVDSGTTGSLFDTAYGGTTIARPATGEATVSIVSGVIGTSVVAADGTTVPAAAILANVSDSDISTAPHIITAEVVSATSIKMRVRRFDSTLGTPGNTWTDYARAFDLCVHSAKKTQSPSILSSRLLKQRRDFLTEAATDWNALVKNQGTIRKALMLEHLSNGEHNVGRIAKAVGWFRPTTGPAFADSLSEGVAGVSLVSTGVVEVTIRDTLSSTSAAACFPQAQPASDGEIIVINGRCHSTTKFRFYIYRYSIAENKWDRADRPFFAAMYGAL